MARQRRPQLLRTKRVLQFPTKPPINPAVIKWLWSEACRLEETDLAQAIEFYNRILELDPDHLQTLVNLGTIHFHKRQYKEAADFYLRAIIANPEYVLAWYDLGTVQEELDDFANAIDSYKKAIELCPDCADAHFNLALIYERTEKRSAAVKHWRAYCRIDRSGKWYDYAMRRIRKAVAYSSLRLISASTVS